MASCKTKKDLPFQGGLGLSAYLKLKVLGSKSGSSQLLVIISVWSFRMAMEFSK